MTGPVGPVGPGKGISPIQQDGPVRFEMGSRLEAPSFGDLMQRVLNDATDLQQGAEDMIGAFLRGENVELHQVMAASEEANISLELLVEIRNKLTDAYRSVMNMQT